MHEFFAARQFTTAAIADIKRARIIADDGGHGTPVACVVLKDGRVGRFLEEDVVILIDLLFAYRTADQNYQLGYGAYMSGAMTCQEMKALERAKKQAFRAYSVAKKQMMMAAA